MINLFKDSNYNFMNFKRFGFILSGLLIILSIFNLFSGLKLGIDFKGGSLIGLHFNESISIEEVRDSLKNLSFEGNSFDLSNEEIKYFGNENDIVIKIKNFENQPDTFPQLIINNLYATFKNKVSTKEEFVLSLGSVSPKVGSELSGQAFWSIISALALILFYVSIRFEFKFAIAAIIALVHDIIITLGIFGFSNFEITLSTIAAFLTIVGYSLNDTIVILDRIRENMKSSGTVMFDSTINKSINQSLSRTLITSLTTLLVIIILLVYGGEIIRPFAFTLLVGVIIGTYSSIFIAGSAISSFNNSSK
jgi:preprotein translocase subunit SecF